MLNSAGLPLSQYLGHVCLIVQFTKTIIALFAETGIRRNYNSKIIFDPCIVAIRRSLMFFVIVTIFCPSGQVRINWVTLTATTLG
jgi:hypothetical protein